MIADIFIRKDVKVATLAELYDRMEAAFGGCADVRILCYARIITITIETKTHITNSEIREAADSLDWVIKDIVRRG